MRILIVTQYFWPENFRINDLAQSLQQRGHKVTVLTGLPNYPQGRWFEGYGLASWGRSDWEGAKLVRVPMIRRMQGKGWQLALNYLSFAFFASLLGPFLCRGKFDLIFVYEPSPFTVGFPAAVMRSFKKAPILFWVQDLWPESLKAAGAVHSPTILNLVGKMVHWIYKRCDRVLVQSRAFVEPAVGAGADEQRVRYFPNWAEQMYQPLQVASDAPERNLMPDGFCVTFAGNLGEAQSLETILGAAERLRDDTDVHWVILGDGRRQEWMQEEVKRLNLVESIHFLGRHEAETMPVFFSLSGALLVTLKPDPVFSITIPSKVQSYLACARPVVAALDGEGARIIEDSEGGRAVPAGDAEALADAVLSLSRMPVEERQAMGHRGREYFEKHFDRNMLLDRLEHWMQELAEEGVCES